MPAKATITASLTPELNAFIAAKVASGQYRTASEVIRAALRSLGQQDQPEEQHVGGFPVPSSAPTSPSPVFLQGGGTMGALMRAHDWSATPLGRAASWPQPLKTLVALMLDSRQPMFIAWGPARVMLYNDGYVGILGQRHPAALGRTFAEVWSDIMSRVGPILDRAYAGESTHMDDIALNLHRNGNVEEAHFAFSYTPVRDEAGQVAGMFCACTETTEQVRARAAAQAERERLYSLFQQAPGFICVLDGPEHTFSLANAAYHRLVGKHDLVGTPVRSALPEVAGQGFFELLDKVFTSGEPFVGRQIPVRLRRDADGVAEDRFVDFLYQPITDASGKVTGIFVEGSDVTERVRGEEHQRLLINELNHRVKNTLATVQAIAHQTFRRDHSAKTDTFEARLLALSKAHDLLTRESWEGAALPEIVDGAVDAFRRSDGARFQVGGPEVWLTPRVALALAMALHELGTNAAKYGALSIPSGRVLIHWTTSGESPTHLLLRWEEQGGPPVVPPTRQGFGSRLIERMLASEMGGEVKLQYEPAGVVCTVEARLDSEPQARPDEISTAVA
ncbi:PAS domain-containing protein [Methylobacterium durans]|uniref:Blue-light-activated histidine kinase n=1 Tax=Methylobacterium durans TaxID=2202825 RepID=A0A2U8WFH0_9HYPH|nr:PAS domain-containing protein [Methylobacterium durans]AWN44022.1 histidine kinase [Methylobacterium durans]